jgi:hypothetical protein
MCVPASKFTAAEDAAGCRPVSRAQLHVSPECTIRVRVGVVVISIGWRTVA